MPASLQVCQPHSSRLHTLQADPGECAKITSRPVFSSHCMKVSVSLLSLDWPRVVPNFNSPEYPQWLQVSSCCMKLGVDGALSD